MRIMSDSGAFTAFTQFVEIDLSAYIRFCNTHPSVDYFVNLDRIPGMKCYQHLLSAEEIDEACEESWNN